MGRAGGGGVTGATAAATSAPATIARGASTMGTAACAPKIIGAMYPAATRPSKHAAFVASPRLVLVANGERHEFKGGTPELTLKRADRVEWRGAETAGGVRVESSSWLEYDGVARIDLTLSADAPTAVKSFVIEFPLHTDVARFCHYNTVWGGHGNPEVPQESGETLDFPWQAMWWLGDHDRGLSLFTDNNF